METAEFLLFIWRDYLRGKVNVEDVIAEYDKHGSSI